MITADELARIAVQLAVRVRDDDPEANGRWLAAELPDPADWFRLAFVLAAAVPDDRSWTALTAWTMLRGIVGQEPADEEPDDVRPNPAPPRARLAVQPRTGKEPTRLVPCGSRAAAQRHRYHREEPCEPCRQAERIWYRNRKRASRAAA